LLIVVGGKAAFVSMTMQGNRLSATDTQLCTIIDSAAVWVYEGLKLGGLTVGSLFGIGFGIYFAYQWGDAEEHLICSL